MGYLPTFLICIRIACFKTYFDIKVDENYTNGNTYNSDINTNRTLSSYPSASTFRRISPLDDDGQVD